MPQSLDAVFLGPPPPDRGPNGVLKFPFFPPNLLISSEETGTPVPGFLFRRCIGHAEFQRLQGMELDAERRSIPLSAMESWIKQLDRIQSAESEFRR